MMCHVEGRMRRSSPENKHGHQPVNVKRLSAIRDIATPRHVLPALNAVVIIAPYFCPVGGHGSPHDIPAAPRSQRPQLLFLLVELPRSACHPDRYSSPNANQHPSARIIVSVIGLDTLDLLFPASWVVAEETHGVQHLSTPAFSSLEAAPARTLHAPFSSSVDRIGQPSGYAYLESASSEGSINSHGPCCQPSAPLSAPGWACCMPSPPIVPQSERLSTTSQQSGCGIVSCSCAA